MERKAYQIGEAYMDYDCDIRYKLRKRVYRNLDKAIDECKRLNDKIVTKSSSNGYRVFEV